MDQLLHGVGELITKDSEKTGVPTTSFTPVFMGKTNLQVAQAPETVGK